MDPLRVTLPVTNVETSQRIFGPNTRVISKRFYGEFILPTSGHKKNWIKNLKLVGKNNLIKLKKKHCKDLLTTHSLCIHIYI